MIFFLGFITGAAAMALVLGLYDVLTRDQIEEDDAPTATIYDARTGERKEYRL